MNIFYYQLFKITRLKIVIFFIFFSPIISYAQKNEPKNTETKSDIILNDKSENLKFSSIATIQILNKTTAKNSLIDLKIGQRTKIGTIILNPKKCWQAPIEQKPETKILIEVLEDKSNTGNVQENLSRIFYGWLFASSPSISGLEHPIYDIVAISCKK